MKSLENSGSLTTDQYKKIKAIGSRPGILYGLCKVHKAITKVCLPFRPWKNRTDVIRLLLQNGANVNKQDRDGDTLVHCAAMYNSTEAIAVLVEQ